MKPPAGQQLRAISGETDAGLHQQNTSKQYCQRPIVGFSPRLCPPRPLRPSLLAVQTRVRATRPWSDGDCRSRPREYRSRASSVEIRPRRPSQEGAPKPRHLRPHRSETENVGLSQARFRETTHCVVVARSKAVRLSVEKCLIFSVFCCYDVGTIP